ncbi:MAG: hypothetical protein OEW90_00975 [Betaproteobacteria bacterium]|nr:hypothetical protein [Betaproteobacteria bacterium]MDH4322690.1 hypothetical protein [Betaproteobacteria bacterium]
MGEITGLDTKTGKSWGSKAAAGDALNRVPNDAPFVAVWVETNDQGEQNIKWAKANTDYLKLCTMAIALMEFAQSCVRESMDRAGS